MQLDISISVPIKKPGMRYIWMAFLGVLKPLLQEITTQTVLAFGKKYMKDGTLAGWYGPCTWKSAHGNRSTYVCTPWGHIDIPQIQIQLANGRKEYITRRILGIERRKHVPRIVQRVMAAISGLSTYRVAAKAGKWLTGFQSCLMSFQRAATRIGGAMKAKILPTETAIFEADGTGVPVKNSTKRGEELKVLSQRRHAGGIRIAGIEVGRYCENWLGVLKPIKSRFSSAMLVSDGDESIYRSAGELGLQHQSCTWHLIRSIKYALWRDGYKGKSPMVSSVVAKVAKMADGRHYKTDAQFQRSVRSLVVDLKRKGLSKTASYLSRVGPDLNATTKIGICNSVTSLTERVMNTLNKRINVGVWSRSGVESIARIRAAIYYNGWEP